LDRYETIAIAITSAVLSGQLSQETQHHPKSRAWTLAPAISNYSCKSSNYI